MPQIAISPPPSSAMRACPLRTITRLPLARSLALESAEIGTFTGSAGLSIAKSGPSTRPMIGCAVCPEVRSGTIRRMAASDKTPTRGVRHCRAGAKLQAAGFILGSSQTAQKNLRLYYTPMEGTSKIPPNESSANTHFDVSLPQYSRWRRMQIPVIAGGVYEMLRIVSPTLRFEVLGGQHPERSGRRGAVVFGRSGTARFSACSGVFEIAASW